MPRRRHRKSRNGCIECKRRHIKCDETRPKCSQCTVSERSCEYAEPFRRVIVGQSPVSNTTPRSSSPCISPPGDLPIPSTGTSSPYLLDTPPANVLHFELLHHYFTETWPSLDKDLHAQAQIVFSSEVATISLRTPYLLNEILAFSALHKSIIFSETADVQQSAFYRHHAAQLQTHALTIFNSSRDDITVTEDNCVPLFLFSGCLGMHMLCDTLVCRPHNSPDDFENFLDRFVNSLRLHTGIRSITGESWSMLRQSALRPVLLHAEAKFDSKTNGRTCLDTECRALIKRIESARLGPSITASYVQAVEALWRAITANDHGTSNPSVVGGTAWPVLVGMDYIDLLRRRRPEALVILAHYAVLIHDCRELWVFGDGGRFLIDSISRYLGVEWEEWLAWPLAVLRNSF
ncbi:hypothetical protein BDV59DRAFT_85179 [Aspergillus ambiguus]|uniref:Zn(II)2Cys6 transcription factor domain-containing protein n=1 Tax=Aspergillus ambiguus TaxID=176160 RepID=UPI003CCD7555